MITVWIVAIRKKLRTFEVRGSIFSAIHSEEIMYLLDIVVSR